VARLSASAPLAKNVEVNGTRLSYVEHGSGEPVLFVHGAFTDLRAWEPIIEAMPKYYRSIAYTQRYFGIIGRRWQELQRRDPHR
jgi:pimeloyl-ACP methyl ester carboxylesterase